MEHMEYGKEAANVVLDENGKVVVDQVYQGFCKWLLQRIWSVDGNKIEKGRST